MSSTGQYSQSAAAAGTVTSRYGWDLSLALLVGAAVGALAMVLVGLPAIRAGGLALGITTLALSLGVPYLLVATKVDKLSQSEKSGLAQACLGAFGHAPLAVSALKGNGLDELWQQLCGLTG